MPSCVFIKLVEVYLKHIASQENYVISKVQEFSNYRKTADTTKKLTSFSDSAHQKIKIKKARPKICCPVNQRKNTFQFTFVWEKNIDYYPLTDCSIC